MGDLPRGVASLNPELISLIPSGSDYLDINIFIGSEVCQLIASNMSLSNKGYKTINHRDVQYRWMMKNRSGVNEASVYTNEAIGGRELIAELPRIVMLSQVLEAIDFANANNWKPNQVGTPMRCKYTRKGFELVG